MSNPMSNGFTNLAISDENARQTAAVARQAEAIPRHIEVTPCHPFLRYNQISSTLEITLNFTISYSPFHHSELATNFNMVFPQYSNFATNIYMDISFKAPNMGLPDNDTSAYRHCIVASIIYQLNMLHQLDSVRVEVSTPNFYWGQIGPLGAIYGLDHTQWSFDVIEHGWGTITFKMGSTVDHRLRYRFFYEM